MATATKRKMIKRFLKQVKASQDLLEIRDALKGLKSNPQGTCELVLDVEKRELLIYPSRICYLTIPNVDEDLEVRTGGDVKSNIVNLVARTIVLVWVQVCVPRLLTKNPYQYILRVTEVPQKSGPEKGAMRMWFCYN